MTIDQWWNLLDAHTRRWLMDNPGCLVLPRTVVNAINTATGGLLRPGPHGEFSLSARDQEFIRQLGGHGGELGPRAGPGSACAAAEALGLIAAGLEAASAADPGAAASRSVLEHLLTAQRSVEATLRHLADAARPAQQQSAFRPAPDGTAACLEEAAVEAGRLLEKLVCALDGLPPGSRAASREIARSS